jgi:diguanylate cyclase (GGDEF)-like protein
MSGPQQSLSPRDSDPESDDAAPDAAHSVPPDVAVRLLRALDRAPSTFATLIDADMRSRWLSHSATWVTGTDPVNRPGRHSLERIHPDDVERIVHGLNQLRAATPADGTGAPVLEPLRYRIRRPDDTWLTVEALVQNLLDDPVVRGLLVIGRPVGGVLDGVGQVVDLLTADAPLPDVLAACAEIVPSYLGAAAVVGLLGDPTVRGEGAPAPVIGVPENSPVAELAADERWWRPALVSGQARVEGDFIGYPEDMAAPARAAGFRTAWALPLTDPSTGEGIGCLVVWARVTVEPNIGTEEGLRQASRLATLVLGEQRRHAALRREAMTDPLTGLGNRAAFRRRLDMSPGAVTVALIDLDGFKPVNDTHGHDVGDYVLEAVANRLLATVREDDCVVRFGGDEFAVVFSDDLPSAAIDGSAERLRQAVEAPIILSPELTVAVGVSIGVATAAAREVVPLADDALYQVKRQKRLDPADPGHLNPD